MKTNALFYAATAITLCTALTTGAPADEQQSHYVVEVLVTVGFGDEDSEIGLSWNPKEGSTKCVSNFVVDASDNVYLGDEVSDKVKKFAPSGELVMVTGSAAKGTPGTYSDGALDSLRRFAVDGEGCVYVIHAGFDVLTKFSVDGKWLWSKRFGEIISRELADEADFDYSQHDFAYIYTTPDGNVLLAVPRRTHVDDFTKRLIGLVLDPDGRPVEVAPSFELVSYAELLASPTPAPELRDTTLTIRDSQEVVTQEIQLDLAADGGIHFEDCVRPPHPHALRDTSGNFYAFSSARLRGNLRLDSEYYGDSESVINKFDSRGQFLEEWRFVRSVFSAGAESCPDRHGNLYHIRFDQEGVEVVRYRRIPEGSSELECAKVIGGGRIHELVSLRTADTTITPLVLLAAKAAAPVAWDQQTRRATVTTNAGPLVLDPERNRATLDGRPVEIGGPVSIRYGRLWVPAVDMGTLLGLPIREAGEKGPVVVAWCGPAFTQVGSRSGAYVPERVAALTHSRTHEGVTLTFVDYGGPEGTSVPYSLSRLIAPSEDVIWLVDPNQAAAKLYDVDGGLVRFVGRPVPPGQPDDRDPTQRQQVRMPDGTWSLSPVESLDLTQDFCATPDGRTFVSDSRSRSVLVFDEYGDLQQDAWRHLEDQVQALTGHETYPKPPTIYVDRYGCLYLNIREPDRSRYFLVKFDPDLECLGTRPGFRPGWDGWTYKWVGGGGAEGPNDVLRVYDPDGQSYYELAIIPPTELAGGDYDPACRHWEATDSAHYDAAGNIYMVLSVPRETPLPIAPDLTVERDIAVYKFDAAGEFVTKLVLEGTPFYMHPRIAVDPQGNIYHVRALAGGIEIIKEKLVGLEAGSAPAEPDYAALRQALEPTGWRVHWVASKGCAVASKRHARVEVRPGPEPAILNGRDIPLPYPAKIIDGQLQVPAMLLARLEKFVEGGLQPAPEPLG